MGARTLDQGSDPQSARGSERVLRGWTPALHEDDEWGCGGRRVSRGKRARRSEARSEGCTGSDRGARGDVVAWCTSTRGAAPGGVQRKIRGARVGDRGQEAADRGGARAEIQRGLR